MKKILLSILILLNCCLCFSTAWAAEHSSDKMILRWEPQRVWLSNGDLLIQGKFTNQREDLTITALEDIVIQIDFTGKAGHKYRFIGRPTKLPLCKLPPLKEKYLTFNLGKFDKTWNTWLADADYTFAYIAGVRW